MIVKRDHAQFKEKGDTVKAREKDVESIKMQADEKLDKSIVYVDC